MRWNWALLWWWGALKSADEYLSKTNSTDLTLDLVMRKQVMISYYLLTRVEKVICPPRLLTYQHLALSASLDTSKAHKITHFGSFGHTIFENNPPPMPSEHQLYVSLSTFLNKTWIFSDRSWTTKQASASVIFLFIAFYKSNRIWPSLGESDRYAYLLWHVNAIRNCIQTICVNFKIF